jgi:hypothetical protein
VYLKLYNWLFSCIDNTSILITSSSSTWSNFINFPLLEIRGRNQINKFIGIFSQPVRNRGSTGTAQLFLQDFFEHGNTGKVFPVVMPSSTRITFLFSISIMVAAVEFVFLLRSCRSLLISWSMYFFGTVMLVKNHGIHGNSEAPIANSLLLIQSLERTISKGRCGFEITNPTGTPPRET